MMPALGSKSPKGASLMNWFLFMLGFWVGATSAVITFCILFAGSEWRGR